MCALYRARADAVWWLFRGKNEEKNIRKQRLTAMGAAKDFLVSDMKKFNIRLIAVSYFFPLASDSAGLRVV